MRWWIRLQRSHNCKCCVNQKKSATKVVDFFWFRWLYEGQCLNCFVLDDGLEMLLHIGFVRRGKLLRITIFWEHITDLVKLFRGVVWLRDNQQITRRFLVLVEWVLAVVMLCQDVGKACHLIQRLKGVNACQVDADSLLCSSRGLELCLVSAV